MSVEMIIQMAEDLHQSILHMTKLVQGQIAVLSSRDFDTGQKFLPAREQLFSRVQSSWISLDATLRDDLTLLENEQIRAYQQVIEVAAQQLVAEEAKLQDLVTKLSGETEKTLLDRMANRYALEQYSEASVEKSAVARMFPGNTRFVDESG